jgi:hypothetical protein
VGACGGRGEGSVLLYGMLITRKEHPRPMMGGIRNMDKLE